MEIDNKSRKLPGYRTLYTFTDGSPDLEINHEERTVEYISGFKEVPFTRTSPVEHPVLHSRLDGSANGLVSVDSAGASFVFDYGSTDGGGTAILLADGWLQDHLDLGQLEFQKNNNFELIPSIFDLDGAIAKFAREGVVDISYGQANWGLLPFISDIRSLQDTLQDLSGRIAEELNEVRAVEKTVPINVIQFTETATFQERFSVQGSVRLHGHTQVGGDFTPTDALAVLADEIGFHPDLKTVWDVIPLSFVADYFFPVGDYLESIHPRGWYNPEIFFSGFITYKLKWHANAPSMPGLTGPPYRGSVYARGATGELPAKHRPELPSWECPSPRELFNTAYLRRSNPRSSLPALGERAKITSSKKFAKPRKIKFNLSF
jgi:hypothetical protein